MGFQKDPGGHEKKKEMRRVRERRGAEKRPKNMKAIGSPASSTPRAVKQERAFQWSTTMAALMGFCSAEKTEERASTCAAACRFSTSTVPDMAAACGRKSSTRRRTPNEWPKP